VLRIQFAHFLFVLQDANSKRKELEEQEKKLIEREEKASSREKVSRTEN
jgi:hypothetical protein